MADLIEFADVQAFYPTADETKSGKLIKGITAKVKRKLGFDPGYAETTDEKIRSCGGEYLDLTRYPLVDVTNVKCDGSELGYWERYPNGDKYGHLRRTQGYKWPTGSRDVSLAFYQASEPTWITATYAAGYALPGLTVPEGTPALPDDVVMEIVDWIGNRLVGRASEIANAGRIATKQQMGAMQIQYAQTVKTRTPQEIDDALIETIVDALKRPGPPC